MLAQEQRHRKLMHLGPSGSKTPRHICKQVHGRHSQFYKDGRDAAKPYRNPTPSYSEFPGHTIHADSAYWDYAEVTKSQAHHPETPKIQKNPRTGKLLKYYICTCVSP